MPDQNPSDAGGAAELQENVTGQPARFSQLQEEGGREKTHNLELILDIDVGVTVELGRSEMAIKEVLELAPGSVIELNKLAGEPVDVLVNGAPVAKGEVVVINEHFGVRITEILGAAARIQNLGAKPAEKK